MWTVVPSSPKARWQCTNRIPQKRLRAACWLSSTGSIRSHLLLLHGARHDWSGGRCQISRDQISGIRDQTSTDQIAGKRDQMDILISPLIPDASLIPDT